MNAYCDSNRAASNAMESFTQFEALFNHAIICIIITGKDGEIIDFNKLTETQFGFSKEELTGKDIEILIPPEYYSQHIHHRKIFNTHPAPRKMGGGRDLYALRKDGTAFPVEVGLSYFEMNGERYIVVFLIDITVRKQQDRIVEEQKKELERFANEIKQLNVSLKQKIEDRTKMLSQTLEDLQQSKEALSIALQTEKELGELKSRFTTMALHEFRTPLSAILSSAFLLQKYDGTEAREKKDKHIQRIKNAVADMKNILEVFLSAEKLEEGLIQTKKEILSAHDCFREIENTVEELKPLLKSGQRIEVDRTGDKSIVTDSYFLKNIVVNLLSNAIKFSPEGSIITIACSIAETELVIAVRDNGIGIEEEDRRHLCERFFRGKNAANIQGTGLGLHIVARYMELLKGGIEIDSNVNMGSCFT